MVFLNLNFLRKKPEFRIDDPTKLAIRGKYLLSKINEETFKNRKKGMINFLMTQDFAVNTIPLPVEELYDFQSFIFNTNSLNPERLKPNLSDKLSYYISGQKPSDSAYFRQLRYLREDLPVSITVRFIPSDDMDYVIDVVIFPSKFIKYSQLAAYKEKFKIEDLSFCTTRSIELVKDIGANLKAKELQEPKIYGQISTEIQQNVLKSLEDFRQDFPTSKKVAFIMMQFGKTDPYSLIEKTIKEVLLENGLIGVRADNKDYHTEKFSNILTYIYGCDFGIAIFDNIDTTYFNPNVSLEIGSMLALNKPVCILKDKPLDKITPDIVGKLYKEFDSDQCVETISQELTKWLKDHHYLNGKNK